MPSVIMQSGFVLNVFKCLNVIMLGVITPSGVILRGFMVRVVMLSVIFKSVILRSECRYAKCRYTKCRFADCRAANVDTKTVSDATFLIEQNSFHSFKKMVPRHSGKRHVAEWSLVIHLLFCQNRKITNPLTGNNILDKSHISTKIC
jgi:hypothetical protein